LRAGWGCFVPLLIGLALPVATGLAIAAFTVVAADGFN
jgi:hypothetical protein